MSKIIEGVVIGITVGVILELFRLLRMIYLRKKQIGYLRKIIEKAKQDIHGADSPPPERSASGKLSMYEWLISELNIILKNRAEGLSDEQRYDLSSFVANHERMRTGLPLLSRDVPPLLEFYEQNVFPKLHAMKWLKLP